jgi:DNA-binding transcriptional LysR family regulator
MDLRHVRTFITIAEQGTVSQAAPRLHVGQPALSRQLHDLEQEIGFKLFDRVGRGLVLTGEGEQLLANCRNLLSYASSLDMQAQELRCGDRGLLRVAAPPEQIESTLSTFLRQYTQRYPNVQVKLMEAGGPDSLNMLESGAAHLGINLLQASEIDQGRFGISLGPSVGIRAVCHPSFRLERGNAIDICRIATYPLLLLDSGFLVRKTFDAACRLAGLRPNIMIESHSPHTLLALAEQEHGIAIVTSVQQIQRYTLRMVNISYERRPLRETITIMWDKQRGRPRYAQEFCELVAAHMHKIFPVLEGSSLSVEGAAKRSRVRARTKVTPRVK